MRALTDRAQLLTEHLNLPNATGVEDAKWERFQVAHLNCNSLFRIEDKSRQIAWSWLIAAEAVADALLDNRSSIFVSINKEEAKEKIRYAKSVFENLEGIRLPKLKSDNQFDLEFEGAAMEGPKVGFIPRELLGSGGGCDGEWKEETEGHC